MINPPTLILLQTFTTTTMASLSPLLALIFLSLKPFLFLTIPQIQAQSAPSPTPAGPINITGILDKAGQYTTLIRLMTSTQVANQITNQLNSSDQGLTLLAPTDNAFNNLKAGTLNGLSDNQQVQLVLYHVLPKYYSLVMFETVSNPVRTQATGQDGGAFGLNFTTSANQVNISTGVVETQLNNALRQEFPLAVYQLDEVLLPSWPKTPKPSPPPSESPTDKSKKSPVSTTTGVSSPAKDSNSGAKGRNVGLSALVVVIGFICMGVI